jgi:hypothetical protein
MLLLYLIELHAIINSKMSTVTLRGDIGILDFVNDPDIDFGLASGDYQARLDSLDEKTVEVSGRNTLFLTFMLSKCNELFCQALM